MVVERCHRPQRVGHQVLVMDLENRLREGWVVCRGDHQLGRRQPTVAVLAPDPGLEDLAACGGRRGRRGVATRNVRGEPEARWRRWLRALCGSSRGQGRKRSDTWCL